MDIAEFLPHVKRLQFPPELEALFRADYYEKSVGTMRLALWLGIVLITPFGLLDVLAAPSALHLIWRIRFLVICPIFAIVLVLSYRPLFMRWMQPLVSLAVISAALASLAAIEGPIIMMSQRRQAKHAQLQASNDYQINLKAELEVRYLNERIDHLLKRQEQLLEMLPAYIKKSHQANAHQE